MLKVDILPNGEVVYDETMSDEAAELMEEKEKKDPLPETPEQQKILDLEKQLEEERKAHEETKSQLIAAGSSQISKLTDQLEKMNIDLSSAHKELEKFQNESQEVQDLKKLLKGAEDVVKENNKKIIDLQKQVKSKNEKIMELQKSQNPQNQEFEAILEVRRKYIEELVRKLEGAEAQKSWIQKRIEKMEMEKDEKIHDLEKKLADLEKFTMVKLEKEEGKNMEMAQLFQNVIENSNGRRLWETFSMQKLQKKTDSAEGQSMEKDKKINEMNCHKAKLAEFGVNTEQVLDVEDLFTMSDEGIATFESCARKLKEANPPPREELNIHTMVKRPYTIALSTEYAPMPKEKKMRIPVPPIPSAPIPLFLQQQQQQQQQPHISEVVGSSGVPGPSSSGSSSSHPQTMEMETDQKEQS